MRQEREKRVATETKKLGERRVVELDSTIHREGQLSKAKPTGEILSRALIYLFKHQRQGAEATYMPVKSVQ